MPPAKAAVYAQRFNPRTCERCDHFQVAAISRLGGFNPRTCERCDAFLSALEMMMLVSIHAPARGATASATFSASGL